MWWPRPRWKSDFFTRFILLVSVTIATTTDVVMADEGQHCGGSNMSAIIWTTALCTMLLVLIVVVIYFLYCKKREHDWSSLWWKSNSDKSIVLQTSPTKGLQHKIGGTDNPAFLADSNISEPVTRTGLTKIVHVPTSDDGSLQGIELSIKEEDDKIIYMCQHNHGSKDRLVAMRLVFGPGKQQNTFGPPSDLSRALAQLSREYGLRVELETEGDAAANTASPAATAARENRGDEPDKCSGGKPNLLSVVRGKAQRLWHQRQMVFKSGADADKDVGGDLEGGPVARATDAAPVQQKSPSVTTVDETANAAVVPQPQQSDRKRDGAGPVQYRTLEYGASPADAAARSSESSSPDSSIQCCTVNSCGPTAAAAVAVTINDKDAATDEHDATTREVDDGAKPLAEMTTKNDEPTKPAAANPPPPPPPRKYSASVAVVPPRGAVAAKTDAAAGGADAVGSPSATAADAADHPAAFAMAPAEPAAPPTATNDIRIDDDYYWCTTTAMATAPMSTFGKQQRNAAGTAGDCAAQETYPRGSNAAVGTVADADNRATFTAQQVIDDLKSAVTDEAKSAADDAADVGGDGGRDVVAAGATTSIEDASLPSFSSDEDDDDDEDADDGVFKSKFACQSSAVATAERAAAAAVDPSGGDGQCNGGGQAADDGDGRRRGDGGKSDAKAAAATAECDAAADPKSTTKLPTLRLSLSSPLSSTATTSCCSSSASSTSSTSSSPTNNGSTNNSSPIVSKIPVRRQSAGSSSSIVSNGGTTVSMSLTTSNGSAKKAIPLPLSRSGSRLAMWSSVN